MTDPVTYTYVSADEKPNPEVVRAALRRHPSFRAALMNTTALQSVSRRG